MKYKQFSMPFLAGIFLFGAQGLSNPQESQKPIEPRLMEAVGGMVDYLENAKTIRLEALVTTEDVSSQLQKLQFDRYIVGQIQRPNKLYFEKRGDENVALWFDGQVATILDRDQKKYTKITVNGNNSDLIEKLDDLGVETPLAGVLHRGLLEHIEKHVYKGDFYGEALIGEARVVHLAMRQDAVDWQIWLDKENFAPKKIVVTSKLLSGMPQHQILVQNLQVDRDLEPSVFQPELPSDSEQIDLEASDNNLLGSW